MKDKSILNQEQLVQTMADNYTKLLTASGRDLGKPGTRLPLNAFKINFRTLGKPVLFRSKASLWTCLPLLIVTHLLTQSLSQSVNRSVTHSIFSNIWKLGNQVNTLYINKAPVQTSLPLVTFPLTHSLNHPLSHSVNQSVTHSSIALFVSDKFT